jgi:hypothetical protein
VLRCSSGRESNKLSVGFKARCDEECVIPSEAEGRVEESMGRVGGIPNSEFRIPNFLGMGWAGPAQNLLIPS